MISKTCPDCGELKALSDFPKSRARPDGHGLYCKACYSARYRIHREKKAAAQGRQIRARRIVPAGMAYCPDCATEKPVEEFTGNRAAASGRSSYCKPCHNTRGRESRERLYGSSRDFHLRRRYGITSAEVDEMIAAQGGLCALCQERKPEHVDHDHLTGRVRGVLCSCCNQGLGNFRDRADILRTAIDYLETTTWQRQRVCTGVYRLTSPRPAARPSASSSELQHLISSRRG